ncbi:MAG: farnesyl-diphosphate farnesyltransferase [Verrucomicrobiota bacterium]|jgi:farnesyl-diphosphate farnesyltransferase
MANELLTDLLKDVSRSFYLTLRVLPAAIRPQIGLAYLLARTTDTIADTEIVSLERRLELLNQLRERILGSSKAPLDFGELAQNQSSPAERVLLERCEESLSLLNTLSAPDQNLVREVLTTITSGQELDLKRFAPLESTLQRVGDKLKLGLQPIIALQTAAELDDYTYRVAGCVGEFWTKMCRAHLFPDANLDDAFLLANGVRFGKGLQLVNILRDLPKDLVQGRCYLPNEQLSALGLKPEDLLKPETEPKLRPLYNEWLDRAEAHLAAGWEYTNRIPFCQMRVRLACAWPILIGRKTIDRLRLGNVLDPQQRIKITRGEVRKIISQSILRYPFPRAWAKLATAS